MKYKIPNKLFELSLSGENRHIGALELSRNLFINLGIIPTEIAEYQQDSKFIVAVFLSSKKKANRFQKILSTSSLQNLHIRLVTLEKKDWRDRWKNDFSPFSLTEKLDVVPTWRKKDYQIKKNRDFIYINTITAFGTGLHDTTRFMSLLIEKCVGRFDSFLDIGTGTGILSMVALKYGAKEVSAIDIAVESIRVAKENFRENNFEFYQLRKSDIKDFNPKSLYDFVASNLTSFDLNRNAKKIFSMVMPGKFLAISGVSRENAALVKRKFTALPLRCVKILKSAQWVAFLFKRIS